MNTKSLLTRIAVPVLSLGLLGGIGATLATSAGASTLPAATMASATMPPRSGASRSSAMLRTPPITRPA